MRAEPSSSLVISTITTILKNQKSKACYNNISSFITQQQVQLSPTQFALVTLAIRSSPRIAIKFFNLTLTNNLCNHSLYSYSSLIHTLARSRTQKQQTLDLIQQTLIKFPNQTLTLFKTLTLTYREFDSAPVVFDLLVQAVIRSKRFDLAVEIVKLLVSRACFLSVETSNELVKRIFEERGSFVGYGLFKEIFGGGKMKPSLSSFNVVLLGLYKDGETGSLEGVWGEMGKRGIWQNGFGYCVLMKAYCEEGRMREAEMACEEMRDMGLTRDCVAYEAMIGGYCGVGEVGKAEEFFREMEMGEIKGSCGIFQHLVKGYCEKGDLGSALLLYKDMCRRGFKPGGMIVDEVVLRLCEENKVLEGLEFLRVAMRKYEVVPKWKCYEVLIKSLCDNGMMEHALEIQGEMAGKGSEPNSEIYKFFIDGYTKEGNDEMVKRLKKEMVDDTKIIEKDD